jgi:GT2 family glycosyltransferase
VSILKHSTSVVIVNWNSGHQLRDAVASVGRYHDGLVEQVVVVDNNSADDSLALLEAIGPALPFRLDILRNTTNTGFGAACNEGARQCTGEFILFLNPDALFFEHSLSTPLRFMLARENADVGVCGVQLIDEHQHIARTCARFPSLLLLVAQALGLNKLPGLHHLNMHMGDWDHATTATVDHVIGAFYLIRAELFRSLGGFDERFFVYLEDLDLSLRVRQAGWRSVYLAEAQAFHAGGGTSRQIMGRRLFYSLRSRLQYGFKHFSPAKAWLLVAVTTIVEPCSRSAFSLLRGGMKDVGSTLEGYTMLWKALPAICRGQK